jgi:hypothetical protein
VTVDSGGNIYIYSADTGDHRIRMVTPDSTIATIAGNGTQRSSGDGGPATSAALTIPAAMAVGPGGTLYFVDGDDVRLLTSTGQ